MKVKNVIDSLPNSTSRQKKGGEHLWESMADSQMMHQMMHKVELQRKNSVGMSEKKVNRQTAFGSTIFCFIRSKSERF